MESAFDRLAALLEKYVPDQDKMWELWDLARDIDDAREQAQTETEEAKEAIDTALIHLDDVARFGWTDRYQDAYAALAAVC